MPDGFVLMASDTRPGAEGELVRGDGMSVSISGDEESIRRYWSGLADGGQVVMPFEKQMWGDLYGMCIDKFGVPWMVDIAQPQ